MIDYAATKGAIVAFTRSLSGPGDRVAQPTSGIGREVLGAASSVVAAAMAKKLIDRAFSSRV